MRSSTFKLRALSGLVFMTAVAASNANFFTNPGFETGDFTGWSVGLTANGATGTQTVTVFPTVLGSPSNAAHFAVGRSLTGTGSDPEGVLLTQSVFLLANTQYNLSFSVAAENLGGNNAQGGDFVSLVNGTTIGSAVQLGTILNGQILRGTVNATYTPAASGTYDVGVRVTRNFFVASQLSQYVDNADVSVVPEPASMIALGAGLLALARRRRK